MLNILFTKCKKLQHEILTNSLICITVYISENTHTFKQKNTCRNYTQQQPTSSSHSPPLAVAVVATWCPTRATTALSKVLLLYLMQVIHHFQALADQPYLPLHVGHGALHSPHLPL